MILGIDTSTPICSVAIFNEQHILSLEEDHSANSHSAKITILIDDALKAAGLDKRDLTSVIVADGPGSYTGLRIGSSAAKALCYALNIPLMAVSNLEATAMKSSEVKKGVKFHVSAIDARRDDVYAMVISNSGEIFKETALTTIDENFRSYLNGLNDDFCLSGNGAAKIIDLLDLNHGFNTKIMNSAANLQASGLQLHDNQAFKNVLFFEPYYMQTPNITKSKKLLR